LRPTILTRLAAGKLFVTNSSLPGPLVPADFTWAETETKLTPTTAITSMNLFIFLSPFPLESHEN
jgi:hypothetical protein